MHWDKGIYVLSGRNVITGSRRQQAPNIPLNKLDTGRPTMLTNGFGIRKPASANSLPRPPIGITTERGFSKSSDREGLRSCWGVPGFSLGDFYLSYHDNEPILFTKDPHDGGNLSKNPLTRAQVLG